MSEYWHIAIIHKFLYTCLWRCITTIDYRTSCRSFNFLQLEIKKTWKYLCVRKDQANCNFEICIKHGVFLKSACKGAKNCRKFTNILYEGVARRDPWRGCFGRVLHLTPAVRRGLCPGRQSYLVNRTNPSLTGLE